MTLPNLPRLSKLSELRLHSTSAWLKVGGYVLGVCLLAGVAIYDAAPAWAERLQSDSYVIQFGNFNSGSGEQTGTSYNLTQTVGQTAPGPFTGLTTQLGSGFQYIYTIGTFRLKLSKLAIDLGNLVIGTHSTDSLLLTVDTKGAGGYTVYTYELHPLRLLAGSANISDTTCDSADCTTSLARPWTNQTIPGFGFNATGDQVTSDFINSTYFRPFANQATAAPMQAIMQGAEVTEPEWATITFKAGINATQNAGEYQTGVVFVAVPGY